MSVQLRAGLRENLRNDAENRDEDRDQGSIADREDNGDGTEDAL